MYFDIAFLSISAIILGIVYFLLFKKNGLKPAGERPARVPRGNVVEENYESDEEEETKFDDSEGKTKKQIAKESKKQEKKEKREAVQHMISNKEKKDDDRRKYAEEKERKREEEERRLEEEALKAEEERKRKEEEEYNKWKSSFQLEQSGLDKDESELEEKNMISSFVNYIKMRKVVQLEDLANEFKINTKDLISRITDLEACKRLTGVIDDRGKYIYIEENEFQAIINYINAKGRFSKYELQNECNRIVRLNPTESDEKKLKEEEKSLMEDAEKELANLQVDLEK